jgi:hypothetical protein
MAISGHEHFRKADDKSGLLVRQCPSLSRSDRWHDKNLYNGLPGLQAFVLDREEGPISTPTWCIAHLRRRLWTGEQGQYKLQNVIGHCYQCPRDFELF